MDVEPDSGDAGGVKIPQQDTTFFTLPRELRDMIYTFTGIVTTTHQIRVCYGKHKYRTECDLPAAFGALSQVNKQIRHEITSLFIKKNEFFIFDCGHELINRKGCVCASIMHAMRKFEIHLNECVRARVYKKGGVWKAKFVLQPELKEDREFEPNEKLQWFLHDGKELLKAFLDVLAREDGWDEDAYLQLMLDNRRLYNIVNRPRSFRYYG